MSTAIKVKQEVMYNLSVSKFIKFLNLTYIKLATMQNIFTQIKLQKTDRHEK